MYWKHYWLQSFFFVTPPILAIKKKNLEEDANSSDELTKDS